MKVKVPELSEFLITILNLHNQILPEILPDSTKELYKNINKHIKQKLRI